MRRSAAAIIMCEITKPKQKLPRGKTREWLKRREQKGAYINIVRELGVEDSHAYKEMLRMDHNTFCRILDLIEENITPMELMSGIKVVRAPERLVLGIILRREKHFSH